MYNRGNKLTPTEANTAIGKLLSAYTRKITESFNVSVLISYTTVLDQGYQLKALHDVNWYLDILLLVMG